MNLESDKKFTIMENIFKDLTEREILIMAYTKLNNLESMNKDHEKRIKTLERLGALLLGGLYVIQYLSTFVFNK